MMNFNDEGYGYYGGESMEDRTPVSPFAAPQSSNNLSGVAKIKVIGVGGAGNNAVDRLIESGLRCAEFIVVNTDNQALARSKATNRIQIGVQLTKGLGAGADPSVGKEAAEENKAEIQNALKDTDLLFITAGMGGGTGTGAAPVIAKLAKEMKILTVAVVTLPFAFEAKRRMDNAMAGIEELRKSVDSIITIPNDKIREVVPKGTSFEDALKVADEVLRQGIRGIAELIVSPALINLDFADVRTTLKGRGVAHMGIGVARGEKRISDAVRCAVCSPLLNTTIEGANSVILNVVGGKDLSLDEVCLAADLVKGVIDYSANVIFGACIDEKMSDEVEVVIIATGFSGGQPVAAQETPAMAAQRAMSLSDKIERTYGERVAAETHPYGQQPFGTSAPYMQSPYAQPAPTAYAQSPYAQPAPYGAYGQPYGTGYAPVEAAPAPAPVAPAEEAAEPATAPATFEPGDPIPAQTAVPAEKEKAKRPRKFFDLFVKQTKKED